MYAVVPEGILFMIFAVWLPETASKKQVAFN